MTTGSRSENPSLKQRPRVLIAVRHYEPAYRFGGPIRSVANLVAALHGDFDFSILCLNTDYRETRPLDGIEAGRWVQRDHARVCYLDVSMARPMKLLKTLKATPFEVLYLNSFFDPLFSALPALMMKLHVMERRPIIVAPRGEFSPGALSLKWLKKALFIRLQSLLRLFAGAYWQATTDLEAEDIRRVLGHNVRIVREPNLSSIMRQREAKDRQKERGHLKIVYLSRITPKKNLATLIRAARSLIGKIEMEIRGPVDDPEYWRVCEREIALLPANVQARYGGDTPHSLVADVLSKADVFVLPTLGENYGHVIHEALMTGCPVVISDRTPWRGLETHGAGYVLPPNDAEAYAKVLQHFVDMGGEEYDAYTIRCRTFAMDAASTEIDIQASRRMLTISEAS